MRPSPPSHPSAQQSPHSQPPSHGQMLSNQVYYLFYFRHVIVQCISKILNVDTRLIFGYFSLLWVLDIQVVQGQGFACHN